jgi:hypothetical protein
MRNGGIERLFFRYIPNVEIVFMAEGVMGILTGVYLNYYDFHHGHILNRGVVKSVTAEADGNEAVESLLAGAKDTASAGGSISMEYNERQGSKDFDGGPGRFHRVVSDEQHANRNTRRSKGSFTAAEEVFYQGAFSSPDAPIEYR